jgi:hypothetical protein
MTTMAAMLGALPLMLGTGVGSELRHPLGITIVGGLPGQPGADPVHHAGHLSLVRPPRSERFGSTSPRRSAMRERGPRRNEHLSDPLHRRPVATTCSRSASRRRRGSRSSCRWRRCRRSISDHLGAGVLPGASPGDVATTVATPLERHLGQIADVTEMTSSSAVGSTRITLQFGLDRDIDGAARDVQAAINAARAPTCRPACAATRPTARSIRPTRRS